MFSGILNIDKPLGMTSHDVVSEVRRLLRIRRVGHTGTLDPEATGILLLCIGRATKFARFFENLEKTYWAVLQLGSCTDTQDATGTVSSTYTVHTYTASAIQRTLEVFRGPIKQVPPMYSAVKHQGQRLYRLARRGKTVTRQARDIFIRHLDCLELRHTKMTLSIACSKGTYIRTLGECIGLELGCGAHIVHLQRCRVGPFTQQESWSLHDLTTLIRSGKGEQALIPLADALSFLPSCVLSLQHYNVLCTNPSELVPQLTPELDELPQHNSSYRLCDPSHRTVAVLQRQMSPSQSWKIYVTV